MIRSANLEDIPRLSELKKEIGYDTYYTLGSSRQFESWAEDVCSHEYFESLLNSQTTILVAEYRSELLGMAAITFMDTYADFSNLYVGLQARGIGSILTEHRMNMARNHISLQPVGSAYELRARCFYNNYRAYQHLLKHGFTPYGWAMLKHYDFPTVMMSQELYSTQGSTVA